MAHRAALAYLKQSIRVSVPGYCNWHKRENSARNFIRCKSAGVGTENGCIRSPSNRSIGLNIPQPFTGQDQEPGIRFLGCICLVNVSASHSYLTLEVDIRSYRGIYYPTEPISSPPILPIPGDPNRETHYGSRLIWPSHSIPRYMGHTFQTLSKLWIMIQEIITLYKLRDNTPLDKQVPLSFTEKMYQNLLDWSDTLLSDMLQGEHSSVHVLFFQSVIQPRIVPFH